MLLFTSDIDWAPEAAIEDMLQLFAQHGVPCTLFCTHPSEVIRNCDRSLFELGIHPNFNGQLLEGTPGRPADAIIAELLSWYPEARAVRSHTLTQNSTLFAKFAAAGMQYEANNILPYSTNLELHKHYTGLWRVPYNWEDDVHWAYGKSFEDAELPIEQEGLFVMNFHPIHVYLNTDCDETYQRAKAHYQDAPKLLQLRNREVAGTRDLLLRTLKQVQSSGIKTCKMSELVAHDAIDPITRF